MMKKKRSWGAETGLAADPYIDAPVSGDVYSYVCLFRQSTTQRLYIYPLDRLLQLSLFRTCFLVPKYLSSKSYSICWKTLRLSGPK